MELQQTIDWTAVREAALNCLDETWHLVCWADWSQDDDYDADRIGRHLAVIDEARRTFKRAAVTLSHGAFDSLALATVGEGPRPDFRFGSVCCATAHEAAFELLRRALLNVENGLSKLNIGSTEELHNLSAESLRFTLSRLEHESSNQGIVCGAEIHQLRAWIGREWAAVSQAAVGASAVMRTKGPGEERYEPESGGLQSSCEHATDFSSVLWYDQKYEFSQLQAACVKVLWEHWEANTPVVGGPTILEEAGSSGDRLRDVFKTKKGNHAAWGTMIVTAGKGRFRLQEPAEK